MKYQAVIFDLYGTPVPTFSEQKYRELIMQIASELAAPPEPFWDLWAESFDDSFLGIIPDSKAKIIYICEKLGIKPEKGKINEQAQLLFHSESLAMVPRPEAAGVLSALKQRKHKIGLISDCVSETITYWENTTLKPFFEVTVFSCAVGVKKPDPRIYRIATERLKVKPQECLYIGDGSSHELTGAFKAGMNPVKIRVPDEIPYFLDEDDWQGTTISSLNEVLNLIE